MKRNNPIDHPRGTTPLSIKVSGDNATYVNERVVGTQYQAWHFVAQVLDPTQRPDVMPGLRALSWWGADEHTWAPQVRRRSGDDGGGGDMR